MDVNACVSLIRAHFPHLLDTISLNLIPNDEGWDSFVLEINDQMIARFPRRSEIAFQLEKEARLLPELSGYLSIAVPQFIHVLLPSQENEQAFSIYFKIQGEPLSSDWLSSEEIARGVARFLEELHSFPAERAVHLVSPENKLEDCHSAWGHYYVEFYNRIQVNVFPLLPKYCQSCWTRRWLAFFDSLGDEPFTQTLVHRDLEPEHILCDPIQLVITGVIDWGDATIGDPAIDFAGLTLTGSPAFVERVLSYYPLSTDKGFQKRIAFYADIVPFHMILYAMDTGNTFLIEEGIRQICAPSQIGVESECRKDPALLAHPDQIT